MADWKDEAPALPGYYWHKPNENAKPHVCLIDRHGKGQDLWEWAILKSTFQEGSQGLSAVFHIPGSTRFGWWLGPITPPDPPVGENTT